jgi:hypothetical protein
MGTSSAYSAHACPGVHAAVLPGTLISRAAPRATSSRRSSLPPTTQTDCASSQLSRGTRPPFIPGTTLHYRAAVDAATALASSGYEFFMATVARDTATQTLSMIFSPPLHLSFLTPVAGKRSGRGGTTLPLCTVRATDAPQRSPLRSRLSHGCACTTLVPASRHNRTYLRP